MERKETTTKQNLQPDVSNNICTEEEFLQDMVELAQDINMSDVSSEKGTVFEIAKDQEYTHNILGDAEDLFCDESLFNSLSLGAGNGIFNEDDSSNSDDNLDPFEKLARQMEDVSGDGGVLKQEISPGIGGDMPSGAMVTFHYSAFLEYSDEPFDSTHLRNKPEKKKLDGWSLLPGLNIALKTMRKNETARFLITPHYAFGKLGCQPRIPGNETLFYEIYIISFVDGCAADTYDGEDQQCATFQEKLEGARGFHRKGNDLFREGNMFAAKNAYMRAAWIMEDAKLQNAEEEMQRGSVLVKVRSNLAQIFLNLKEPARACTQCKLGLAVTGVYSDDVKSKLHYRFGKARTMLYDFKGALKELRKAQRLRPNNADISTALESLLIRKEKYEEQEKFLYKRMFQTSDGTEVTQEGGVSKQNDVNHNVLRVRPEFQQIVQSQILEFAADPNVKELPYPCNLSQDEIAYVAAAAKAANLQVTLTQRGMEKSLKIFKNN